MNRLVYFLVASVLFLVQLPSHADDAAVDALPPGTEVMQPAAPLPADPEKRLETLKKNGRPHFALILAGGGARGAAHIGVFKVLEAEGIKPDLVCGNSIGSILGALYCAGVPAATIEKWMLDGTINKVLFPRPIQIQTALFAAKFSLMRLLRFKQDIGMYSGKKIAKFINSKMPPGVTRMEDLPIPLAVIATNILDTRPVWLTSGNIGEAVRASSTVPLVYKPTKLDGRLLVDGGIRSNLPLDAARATGADVVVAVKLHSTLDAKKASEFRTMKSFADRIMSILIAEIEAKNVGQADILIEPEIVDDSLYSFKRESMKQAMEAGEKAAREALPQIRAALEKSATTAARKQAPAM